jgi:hypothetical protein
MTTNILLRFLLKSDFLTASRTSFHDLKDFAAPTSEFRASVTPLVQISYNIKITLLVCPPMAYSLEQNLWMPVRGMNLERGRH